MIIADISKNVSSNKLQFLYKADYDIRITNVFFFQYPSLFLVKTEICIFFSVKYFNKISRWSVFGIIVSVTNLQNTTGMIEKTKQKKTR